MHAKERKKEMLSITLVHRRQDDGQSRRNPAAQTDKPGENDTIKTYNTRAQHLLIAHEQALSQGNYRRLSEHRGRTTEKKRMKTLIGIGVNFSETRPIILQGNNTKYDNPAVDYDRQIHRQYCDDDGEQKNTAVDAPFMKQEIVMAMKHLCGVVNEKYCNQQYKRHENGAFNNQSFCFHQAVRIWLSSGSIEQET